MGGVEVLKGEPEVKDVHRYCLKVLMKVWNGFSKFLNH